MSEQHEQRRGEGHEAHDHRRYYQLAGSAVTLIAVGTVLFKFLEDEWSWIDSFYFSVVAATTVGFGDLSPTTDVSKLFTVMYIVVGISIVAAYLDARFKRHAMKRADRSER